MTEHQSLVVELVVDTPDIKVDVAVHGNGPAVVYLHDVLFDRFGADGSVPAVVSALGANYTVYAPSLPGFSDLSQLQHFHAVGDYVMWLRDVLKGLELEDAHVVGTGLGGWIAAEYAVIYPGTLRSLSLVNAFGLRVEGHPTARFFHAAAPNPLGGRREVREMLFADPDSAPAQEAMPDYPEDDVNERFFNAMHAAARIGWQPPTFYDQYLAGKLKRIDTPTHVIWGTENALVDLAHAEAYAEGIDGATLTRIDGAGHAVVLERPDELAKLVAAFLDQHGEST